MNLKLNEIEVCFHLIQLIKSFKYVLFTNEICLRIQFGSHDLFNKYAILDSLVYLIDWFIFLDCHQSDDFSN